MTDPSSDEEGKFPDTAHLPELFREDYERLAIEIVKTHGRWNRFVKLFGTSDRRVELLNEVAPQFFADLQQTYRDAVVLGIVRLSDSPEMHGDQNLVLEQLIRRAREVRDDDLADTLSDQLGDIKDHCDDLETWRHKSIAHLDRDVSHKKAAFEESLLPDIPRETFDEALSLIEKFMQTVEDYYGGVDIRFNPTTQRDTRALIANLKKAVDHEDLMKENVLSPIRINESRFSDA
jgi:hypothetical protein